MAAVTNSGRKATAEKLDEALEDTFPASDPPSYTPITHVGEPPPPEIEEFFDDDGDSWSPLILRVLVGIAALAFIGFVIYTATQRRQRKSRRSAPTLSEIGETISSVVGPAVESARETASRRLRA